MPALMGAVEGGADAQEEKRVHEGDDRVGERMWRGPPEAQGPGVPSEGRPEPGATWGMGVTQGNSMHQALPIMRVCVSECESACACTWHCECVCLCAGIITTWPASCGSRLWPLRPV